MLRRNSDSVFEPENTFHLFGGKHFDGVPRATVQEAAIGPFAGTLLAADAERRIHFNPAEGRMVLIRHPIHAVGHGAIRDAGRRAGAAGAAFGDDGQFLGPLLARCFYANGFGFALDDFPTGDEILRQAVSPRTKSKSIFPDGGGDVKGGV